MPVAGFELDNEHDFVRPRYQVDGASGVWEHHTGMSPQQLTAEVTAFYLENDYEISVLYYGCRVFRERESRLKAVHYLSDLFHAEALAENARRDAELADKVIQLSGLAS